MAKSKVSDILKKLMLEKKITGTKLAHDIGITKQSISDYLRGNATPKSDILLKMAEYFKVSPEYLLNGIEPKDDNELRLSGSAIRLLKQCDDETIGYIDKLLSDAEFYSALVHTVAMRDKEGENIINLHKGLKDEISNQDKFIIYKNLIESSNAGLSFSDLWHYLIKFINRNTSFEKATKILSDMERNFRKKEHGAIHHLI